eukprot:m.10701 g.10701  ORF g.10701 m.10701 type:complete len:419 (-) comp5605_c0_seq1:1656-2912(-)
MRGQQLLWVFALLLIARLLWKLPKNVLDTQPISIAQREGLLRRSEDSDDVNAPSTLDPSLLRMDVDEVPRARQLPKKTGSLDAYGCAISDKDTLPNTAAILVYVENAHVELVRLSWLYLSWRMTCLNQRFDLVVFHPETIFLDVPQHEYGLHVVGVNITGMKDPELALLANPDAWLHERVREYKHWLVTKPGSMLTPHMWHLTPGGYRFVLGTQSYAPRDAQEYARYEDMTRDIHNQLGYKQYSYVHNVGFSMFGRAALLLPIYKRIERATQAISAAIEISPAKERIFPGWDLTVYKAYARHIAVNTVRASRWVTGYVDVPTTLTDPLDNTVAMLSSDTFPYNSQSIVNHTTSCTSTASPQPPIRFFDQSCYFAGDYRSVPVPPLLTPPSLIHEYALWIAKHAEAMPWSPVRHVVDSL